MAKTIILFVMSLGLFSSAYITEYHGDRQGFRTYMVGGNILMGLAILALPGKKKE